MNNKGCNGCDPNQICISAGVPVACCTGYVLGTCPLVGSCAVVQGSFPIRVALNGVCLPRSYPPGDVDCTTDAECHTCAGGDNAGKTCGKKVTDCPNGSCSASGTCQLAGLSIVSGTKNANNDIPLTVPQSSLVLNPAMVSGIGAVCVRAGGDGTGLMDCDGGHANLNATSSRDHNTTPHSVCNAGTTNQGQTCTKDSDCGTTAPEGSCYNGNGLHGPYPPTHGLPDDSTCSSKLLQPDGSWGYGCLEETKQCSGGTNEGAVCTTDADCPGSTCAFCSIGTTQTCAGGSKAGKACSTATDCPGGTCVIKAVHPGVCNSPSQVVQSGSFTAGDIAIALPLGITILSAPVASGPPPANWGLDGLACTADDTAAPSPPVTVLLSTGTNSVTVFDANNIASSEIAPDSECGGGPCNGCGGKSCVAKISGKAGSCTNLTAGNLSGVVLGGGFPATDSQAGDIATIFQFVPW